MSKDHFVHAPSQSETMLQWRRLSLAGRILKMIPVRPNMI